MTSAAYPVTYAACVPPVAKTLTAIVQNLNAGSAVSVDVLKTFYTWAGSDVAGTPPCSAVASCALLTNANDVVLSALATTAPSYTMTLKAANAYLDVTDVDVSCTFGSGTAIPSNQLSIKQTCQPVSKSWSTPDKTVINYETAGPASVIMTMASNSFVNSCTTKAAVSGCVLSTPVP